ncbi:MAG: ABC transporter ATP-binding protein [Firmicutes bacterium]|nr:ABC transporter ATP-binding protein [Bacillota bacterium]
MSYLEVLNVCKSFDNHRVLKNINLSIEKNEFVTLLGPSGCGKTTLLRSIAGLNSIDSGRIFLDGEDITYRNPRDRNIGMIFQAYCLFPTMTVYDNVAYGLKLKKMPKEEIRTEVNSVLESMNLMDKAKSFPAHLSGGERQRVALARTLVMKPKILLLDEPFNAIDAKLRKSLQLTVKDIHKKFEMTSILVTHDQEEAMRMSDTIHLFSDGVIEQSGTSNDLYLEPTSEYVATFMGNYNVIDARDFRRITQGRYQEGRTVALRPEAIELEKQKFTDAGSGHIFEGVITSSVPQGAIMRFGVETEGVELNVDVLVDKATSFAIGEKVHLRILADKILRFDS